MEVDKEKVWSLQVSFLCSTL